MLKKKILGLITFVLVIACAFVPNFGGYDVASAKTYDNIQVYSNNGEERTIYWTKGITAPKMADDKSGLLGSEGFFEREEINGYITYQSAYEQGNGYYDLNKDMVARPTDAPTCYLGAASNQLYWWLEQNSSYVNRYIDELQNGSAFGQPSGLKPLIPYDNQLWTDILSQPNFSMASNNLTMQQLTLSPMVITALAPFVEYNDGYYMDRVIDFFINGYNAISFNGDRNNSNEFVKDNRGGFFYPIFGKQQLSERYNLSNYDRASDIIKNALTSGKSVSIAYNISSNLAHALTVWGAEYNSQGKLVRIYITDTDDNGNNTISKPNEARGIHSMEVKVDSSGSAFLTSNPNATKGVRLQNIMTLDLATDIWEERLNDLTEPSVPQIISEPEDVSYNPKSSASPLKIDSKIIDNKGYLTYQWYTADSKDGVGEKINLATTNAYTPDISKVGTKYYYCEVTNNKNGKETVATTRRIKVLVDDNLVDALAPIIKMDTRIKKYAQFSSPNKIYASATSPDGGVLTYEWYMRPYGDSTVGGGVLMEGETKDYIVPQTTTLGRVSYYCKVTNYNKDATGNKSASKMSDFAKVIEIYESELTDASKPIINNILYDNEYYINDDTIALTVDAFVNDGGFLTYDWYEADSEFAEGNLVQSGNKNYYKPSSEVVGTRYYYCLVTNTNDKASVNKIASTLTNRAKILVKQKEIPKPNNKLVSLQIEGATINPTFSPDITEYTVNVSHSTVKLAINATTSEKASINISDTNLVIGSNIITITVTSNSGDSRKYTINAIRSDEHDFGEWEIVVQPTQYNKGLRRRVCKVCSKVEEEEIPMLDIPLTPIEPSEPVEPQEPTEPNIPDIQEGDNSQNNNAISIGLGVSIPLIIIVVSIVIVVIKKKK